MSDNHLKFFQYSIKLKQCLITYLRKTLLKNILKNKVSFQTKFIDILGICVFQTIIEELNRNEIRSSYKLPTSFYLIANKLL